jgi:hypothetical protein
MLFTWIHKSIKSNHDEISFSATTTLHLLSLFILRANILSSWSCFNGVGLKSLQGSNIPTLQYSRCHTVVLFFFHVTKIFIIGRIPHNGRCTFYMVVVYFGGLQ